MADHAGDWLDKCRGGEEKRDGQEHQVHYADANQQVAESIYAFELRIHQVFQLMVIIILLVNGHVLENSCLSAFLSSQLLDRLWPKLVVFISVESLELFNTSEKLLLESLCKFCNSNMVVFFLFWLFGWAIIGIVRFTTIRIGRRASISGFWWLLRSLWWHVTLGIRASWFYQLRSLVLVDRHLWIVEVVGLFSDFLLAQ